MAQSNVTIFGLVDMGIAWTNKGTTGDPAASVNGNAPSQHLGAINGGWSVLQGAASRLGFRGREDLGGGLYAAFEIQHRFLPDTGQNSPAGNPALFWGAKSFVRLGSQGIGELELGRNYVPAFYVALEGDPTQMQYTGQFTYPYTLAGFGSGIGIDGSSLRHSNAVTLRSADLNGFNFTVMRPLGENNYPKASLGYSLVYRKNAIYAGYAHEGWDSANHLDVVTLAYDLGFIRPTALYAQAKGGYNFGATAATPTYRATSWVVGGTAPLGSGRLMFGVGHYDPTKSGPGVTASGSGGAPAVLTTSQKYMVGYEYYLSKRTLIYGTADTAKKEKFTQSNALNAGIQHTF
jgi:predicted porin